MMMISLIKKSNVGYPYYKRNITTDVWVAINKIPLKGTYMIISMNAPNIQMTGWIIIDSLY